MISKDKILVQLAKIGFFENEKVKTPATLLWKPDLVVRKNDENYFILFRTSNTILSGFLNRISKTSTKYHSIIIFEKKCKPTEEKDIISQGISIGYFTANKLNLLLRSPKKNLESQVKKKKLPVIDIFISSKQEIEEREFVAEIIEKLRQIHSYPFNPPHKIEYNKFDLNKLYQYIDSEVDKCEWIVFVLEDNYSEVVSYEINRAIKKLEHNNIFMFVKSTKNCQLAWKKELTKVKKLETKSIKYLPYSSTNDLEITLTKAIHVRMNEIYKKNKISVTE